MVKKDDKAQNKSESQTHESLDNKGISFVSETKTTSVNNSSFSDLNLNKKNTNKAPIFLTYNAYKRMICYALRYAREDISEKSWKEVYGILIGSIESNNELFVKEAIPMIVGDRAGVKYENKQYVDMAQIDESIYEKSIQDEKNDFIVGWWHTHPGFKFMFSDVDMQTQLGYQIPNPLAVGLIFNHTELKSIDFYLGLAALRIVNPDQGLLATYDYVNIKTEFQQEKMVSNAEREAIEVNKHINKVIKELGYIDQILRLRYLAQLQRNYGLIMVPKDQIRLTDDPIEAEDDERVLYEWDPDFYKKRYRVPKFREKIELEIKKFENELIQLKNSNEIQGFDMKKRKYQKKLNSLLAKPGEWLDKITKEFTKRVDIISPYFDYLDTNERKIIEIFEYRSFEYRSIYNELQSRAEFNL
ncbi:MAG: hypothetical protein ACFFKA_12625 [Candidatus Thorarchaeota archaeon]